MIFTSGAIILSAVLGYLLLGGQLDIFIGLGFVCDVGDHQLQFCVDLFY